jgi:hypothetical protein
MSVMMGLYHTYVMRYALHHRLTNIHSKRLDMNKKGDDREHSCRGPCKFRQQITIFEREFAAE